MTIHVDFRPINLVQQALILYDAREIVFGEQASMDIDDALEKTLDELHEVNVRMYNGVVALIARAMIGSVHEL
jgi:hypothetical protein